MKRKKKISSTCSDYFEPTEQSAGSKVPTIKCTIITKDSPRKEAFCNRLKDGGNQGSPCAPGLKLWIIINYFIWI